MVAELGSLSGQVWYLAAVGVTFAGLALVVGRRLLAGRGRAGAPAAQEGTAPEAPSHDPFERGSVVERRSAPRRRGNPIELALADAEDPAQLLPAWVVDRSVGGLRILVEQALAEGTVLKVRPGNARHGMPWVEVEVRSCRPHDPTTWELGCQFRRTPPWNMMLAFG